MAAKLLFVGDIHLGRRPTRLPEDLAEHGVEPHELTPAAAWRTTVDFALERASQHELDAVVLAGDVVENLDDRFEAYTPLAAGVAALVDAGVPVFGVAGNHDVFALPRLADRIPGFRLLGRGGRWEHAHIAAGGVGGDDGDLHLLGWSFPVRTVSNDPTATLAATRPGRGAVLGVLHCDVDGGASSVYAPVARAALKRAPVDAWLLGHIHQPSTLEGDRPIGYLGSLVGLDPGESGRRGPWLVEVDGPGHVRATHLAWAPLRYEREDVPLDDVFRDLGDPPSSDDLDDRCFAALLAGLERVRDRLAGEAGLLRAVACRLRVVGRTPHHGRLRAMLEEPSRWPRLTCEGVHYFIERVEDGARPAFDLDRLSRESDPPGLLARRLLVLEQGGVAASELAAAATQRFRQSASRSQWRGLDMDPPDEAETRGRLLAAGLRLLDDLLADVPAAEERTR